MIKAFMMKQGWFIGLALVAFVCIAEESSLDFSAAVRKNQEEFKCENTVVMLYDVSADKIIASTPGANEVRFRLGSLIKPIITDEAIRKKIVDWASVIDCENGKLAVDGKFIRDVHPYGKLTVAENLLRKSNIGTYKIILLVGASAVDSRLNPYNIKGHSSPFERCVGNVITTPEQVVRLYTSLSAETRDAMKQSYTATTVPDDYFKTKKYFPCMVGFVKYKGKAHILFVGTFKQPQPPSYYANTVVKPLWNEIADLLQEKSKQ